MSIMVETLILVVGVTLLLWAIYPLIQKSSSLMEKFKPCRGDWWEAYLRGCETWNGKPLPVEPINSYTNVAYLAAGWITFRLLDSPPSLVFALAMAYLCIGSALYHGVKTIWAAALDHSGMYAVFSALAIYAMAPDHRLILIPMIIGTLAAAYFLRYVFHGNVSVRMGLLLSLMLVGALLRGNSRLGLLSIGLFAGAMAVWQMDKKRILWKHWGHGIWHIFTAAAMAAMFLALTP
ncbi:MAG: hypothetical protein JSW03_00545 [Candidatus Eiseniibacteriota bacterium]|nr:MAG: hypothetical protein JSW03_00545 [Candidatus Eisenbacteria bacterium]